MSDHWGRVDARFSTQDHKVAAMLLEQILAKAHPLLAEGINLAAIPHTFDVPLFTALRAADDGRANPPLLKADRHTNSAKPCPYD